MKQRIISILAFVMLIIGLSLLLYPMISNFINIQKQRRAIYNYASSVETISDEDYSALLEEAAAFNTVLAESPSMLGYLPVDLQEKYDTILDITGTGIMGYVDVPKADISLPIYHGTSKAVLQSGSGHLEGSSFPIDGESVHAVISGHRGLPSAMLFTNLEELEVGDTFAIYILNESYVYRVTEIETVGPKDIRSLMIEDGKNLCTLMTCTPYGINSHRLLIHGEKLDSTDTEEYLAIQSGAKKIPVYQIVLIFEIPILAVAAVVALKKTRKKR